VPESDQQRPPQPEPSFPEPRDGESDDGFRQRARQWFDSGEDRGSEGEWMYLCSLWGISPDDQGDEPQSVEPA
jgi:hypothetical protein